VLIRLAYLFMVWVFGWLLHVHPLRQVSLIDEDVLGSQVVANLFDVLVLREKVTMRMGPIG
jgi:hypothetical protein